MGIHNFYLSPVFWAIIGMLFPLMASQKLQVLSMAMPRTAACLKGIFTGCAMVCCAYLTTVYWPAAEEAIRYAQLPKHTPPTSVLAVAAGWVVGVLFGVVWTVLTLKAIANAIIEVTAVGVKGIEQMLQMGYNGILLLNNSTKKN